MITGIDHVVILVDDLNAAIEQYQALGFDVESGGRHPRFTENALVSVGDGSYLELIAFYETEGAEQHRWHKYLASGGGLVDYAVGTGSVESQMETARERGVAYDGPNAGARTRPDGRELRWKTATPAGGDTAGLPFLIEDVTDRDLRVPGGSGVAHPNGVEMIETLVVAVRDLHSATERHRQLFGTEPRELDVSESGHGIEGVAFKVGRHTIELHAPTMAGGVTEELDARGEGPYEVIFRGGQTDAIDPQRAGNARLTIVDRES